MTKNGYLCIQAPILNKSVANPLKVKPAKTEYKNLSVIGVAMETTSDGDYKIAFAFYSPNEKSPFTKICAKSTAFAKLRNDKYVKIPASEAEGKKIYEIYIDALYQAIDNGLAPRWVPKLISNATQIKIGLKTGYRDKNTKKLLPPTTVSLISSTVSE